MVEQLRNNTKEPLALLEAKLQTNPKLYLFQVSLISSQSFNILKQITSQRFFTNKRKKWRNENDLNNAPRIHQ